MDVLYSLDVDPGAKLPAKAVEGAFNYVNKTARVEFMVVKKIINQWYRKYPVQHRKDLEKRFKSKDDYQHYAAFFELYCHELLLSHGFDVEVHPTVSTEDGTHPDFLVSSNSVSQFYFEVTTICKDKQSVSDLSRYAAVVDSVNYLDLKNCFLAMDVREKGTTTLSSKSVCQFLKSCHAEWIKTANSQIVSSVPAIYRHEAWELEFRFIFSSSKDATCRTIGVYPSGGVDYGIASLLSKKLISKKEQKYNLNGVPYIVAINSLDTFGADYADIVHELFGPRYDLDTLPLEADRSRAQEQGAWFNTQGYCKKGQSAVLFVEALVDWTMFSSKPVVYHHPFANSPLSDSLIRLTQLNPIKNIHPKYCLLSGTAASSLLGIPASLDDAGKLNP